MIAAFREIGSQLQRAIFQRPGVQLDSNSSWVDDARPRNAATRSIAADSGT
jgi:hypothetical protein